MPVDLNPTADGNIRILPDDGGQPNPGGQVLGGTELEIAIVENEPLYRSHFVTCPNAEEWRR